MEYLRTIKNATNQAYINRIAGEASRETVCEICGCTEGVRIYSDFSPNIWKMLPENTAIGFCRGCNAVTMIKLPNLFSQDDDDDTFWIDRCVLEG